MKKRLSTSHPNGCTQIHLPNRRSREKRKKTNCQRTARCRSARVADPRSEESEANPNLRGSPEGSGSPRVQGRTGEREGVRKPREAWFPHPLAPHPPQRSCGYVLRGRAAGTTSARKRISRYIAIAVTLVQARTIAATLSPWQAPHLLYTKRAHLSIGK